MSALEHEAAEWLSGHFGVKRGDVVDVHTFVRDFANCYGLLAFEARIILIRAILQIGAWPKQ